MGPETSVYLDISQSSSASSGMSAEVEEFMRDVTLPLGAAFERPGDAALQNLTPGSGIIVTL